MQKTAYMHQDLEMANYPASYRGYTDQDDFQQVYTNTPDDMPHLPPLPPYKGYNDQDDFQQVYTNTEDDMPSGNHYVPGPQPRRLPSPPDDLQEVYENNTVVTGNQYVTVSGPEPRNDSSNVPYDQDEVYTDAIDPPEYNGKPMEHEDTTKKFSGTTTGEKSCYEALPTAPTYKLVPLPFSTKQSTVSLPLTTNQSAVPMPLTIQQSDGKCKIKATITILVIMIFVMFGAGIIIGWKVEINGNGNTVVDPKPGSGKNTQLVLQTYPYRNISESDQERLINMVEEGMTVRVAYLNNKTGVWTYADAEMYVGKITGELCVQLYQNVINDNNLKSQLSLAFEWTMICTDGMISNILYEPGSGKKLTSSKFKSYSKWFATERKTAVLYDGIPENAKVTESILYHGTSESTNVRSTPSWNADVTTQSILDDDYDKVIETPLYNNTTGDATVTPSLLYHGTSESANIVSTPSRNQVIGQNILKGYDIINSYCVNLKCTRFGGYFTSNSIQYHSYSTNISVALVSFTALEFLNISYISYTSTFGDYIVLMQQFTLTDNSSLDRMMYDIEKRMGYVRRKLDFDTKWLADTSWDIIHNTDLEDSDTLNKLLQAVKTGHRVKVIIEDDLNNTKSFEPHNLIIRDNHLYGVHTTGQYKMDSNGLLWEWSLFSSKGNYSTMNCKIGNYKCRNRNKVNNVSLKWAIDTYEWQSVFERTFSGRKYSTGGNYETLIKESKAGKDVRYMVHDLVSDTQYFHQTHHIRITKESEVVATHMNEVLLEWDSNQDLQFASDPNGIYREMSSTGHMLQYIWSNGENKVSFSNIYNYLDGKKYKVKWFV